MSSRIVISTYFPLRPSRVVAMGVEPTVPDSVESVIARSSTDAPSGGSRRTWAQGPAYTLATAKYPIPTLPTAGPDSTAKQSGLQYDRQPAGTVTTSRGAPAPAAARAYTPADNGPVRVRTCGLGVGEGLTVDDPLLPAGPLVFADHRPIPTIARMTTAAAVTAHPAGTMETTLRGSRHEPTRFRCGMTAASLSTASSRFEGAASGPSQSQRESRSSNEPRTLMLRDPPSGRRRSRPPSMRHAAGASRGDAGSARSRRGSQESPPPRSAAGRCSRGAR